MRQLTFLAFASRPELFMNLKRSRIVPVIRLVIFVLALATLGFSQSEFIVYDFAGATLGTGPEANLIDDKAGNLYGTTAGGGPSDSGTVFELVRPVAGKKQWTASNLYVFSGKDGANPVSGLVFDAAGNLYGTTSAGGTFNKGTVFELLPPPVTGGNWTEVVLYNFRGVKNGDGDGPPAGLVFDKSGNLYGVTQFGGLPYGGSCSQRGCGVVFELTPSTGGGEWIETLLHEFKYGLGGNPTAALILDSAGHLYGTTYVGGKGLRGLVYRLTPPASGGTWSFKVLHAFTAGQSDGGYVRGGVTLQNGSLYGTTYGFGQWGSGTLFEIKPPASPGDPWTESVLYSFRCDTGCFPYSTVISDAKGNLYGTTRMGGGSGGCIDGGCGTVYRLAPPPLGGTIWTETVLHAFPSNPNGKDGTEPIGGLLLGANGVLYGTTDGDVSGGGAVFGVAP